MFKLKNSKSKPNRKSWGLSLLRSKKSKAILSDSEDDLETDFQVHKSRTDISVDSQSLSTVGNELAETPNQSPLISSETIFQSTTLTEGDILDSETKVISPPQVLRTPENTRTDVQNIPAAESTVNLEDEAKEIGSVVDQDIMQNVAANMLEFKLSAMLEPADEIPHTINPDVLDKENIIDNSKQQLEKRVAELKVQLDMAQKMTIELDNENQNIHALLQNSHSLEDEANLKINELIYDIQELQGAYLDMQERNKGKMLVTKELSEENVQMKNNLEAISMDYELLNNRFEHSRVLVQDLKQENDELRNKHEDSYGSPSKGAFQRPQSEKIHSDASELGLPSFVQRKSPYPENVKSPYPGVDRKLRSAISTPNFKAAKQNPAISPITHEPSPHNYYYEQKEELEMDLKNLSEEKSKLIAELSRIPSTGAKSRQKQSDLESLLDEVDKRMANTRRRMKEIRIPKDYLGNFCGVNNAGLNNSFTDQSKNPVLYFINPTQLADLSNATYICLPSCPNATAVISSPAEALCQYGITPTNSNLASYIYSGQCAGFTYASTPVLFRCVPTEPIPVTIAPIFLSLAILILMAYFLVVLLYLTTITKDITVPFVGTISPANAKNMIYYHVAGFIWTYFTIFAISETTAAGAVAEWYWLPDKTRKMHLPVIRSLGRVFRYHLGSMVLGAAIITIVELIRIFLFHIQKKVSKSKVKALKYVVACAQCCMTIVEKIVKFVNKNAYVFIAITGKAFFKSAGAATALLLRNAAKTIAVNYVADATLFLAKLIVVGTNCFGAYFFIVCKPDAFKNPINFPAITVVFVGLETYLISAIFFGNYHLAIDTIFLSVLEDLEINDGSSNRPYMMTEKMRKIMRKKNEKVIVNSW
ncbi:hypothetical protein HDV01_001875 [Terramyces sp. JEL0728]|nr:hypothetical protein HDV01_001875 [Terramyces sp. JEL0728]